VLLIAVIATATSCLSQSAPSTAPPPAPPGAASSAPAPTAPPVATLKANAQLVIVDVVVTDSSHKPVHGLKASDFTLLENGAPQTVKNLEEHTALTVADATRFLPMPALPTDVFTNYTPAPASGAANIVLLDTLNTPLQDQDYVRQQLLVYLKSVPPGTRIAIFGLTDHLLLLQGFTSDPAVLRTYLESHVGKASPLLDDPQGGGGIQNSEADDLEDASAVSPTIIADLREFEAEQQSFELQARAKDTLNAFNQLARYLSNIPGRKNLVWFSGSFPIDVLPDSSDSASSLQGHPPNPFAAVANFEDEFRQTTDLLGQAQVAVYPVNAHGLTTSPVFDVTTTRNYGGKNGNARMTQDQTKFISDTADERATMSAMADATGGHAFVNTNDLTSAVADAIEQGSNFYTLAYTPANATLDGKLHKIKVQIARPGLTLAYRKGYYADPPDKTTTTAIVRASAAPDQAGVSTNGISPRDTLRLAMTRGAPVPTDILIEAGVFPLTPADKPENSPAPGNTPTSKAQSPWRRYAVNYLIDPPGLVFFHAADGKIQADFDLILFVYSADGVLLNTRANTVHIDDTMDQLRRLLAQGILCHEEISAPAKGESFLRIAVHDLHRDHYGAVEVATSQVSRGVPYTPPAPAATAPVPAATAPATPAPAATAPTASK